MFFPEKIVSINPSDKVLEIGPGGTPHPRSDVFLERIYATEEAWASQRGHAPKLVTDKKIVYYDGGRFPFDDNEFDYVICSHVIEHVDDFELFLSEMFRVAPKGYLEYPTICYEYLYNFSDHLNFVKRKDGILVYLRKEETHLHQFLPVQKILHQSFGMGYSRLVEDLKPIMFEGFEWTRRFTAKRASSIEELVGEANEIPPFREQVSCNVLRYVARKVKRFFFAVGRAISRLRSRCWLDGDSAGGWVLRNGNGAKGAHPQGRCSRWTNAVTMGDRNRNEG